MFELLILIFSSQGADGSWVYEDPAIEVKDGDTVYYWILVMVNGGGYQVIFLLKDHCLI